MGSYKVYAFLVGYIVFMTFILGEVEQYTINSKIEETGLKEVTIWNYLEIFWGILTFNISSGTEDIPFWFNLLIIIPFYALIIYFIADMISPTISD